MNGIRVTDDLETCLRIRRIVFTEEQGVSEADEVDGKDGDATHLLAFDGQQPIGTARMLFLGDTTKVGRVAVLKEARGTGQGKALIQATVDIARASDARQVKLGAQISAIGFYEGLGFRVVGPEYMDAGIPHRDMVLAL